MREAGATSTGSFVTELSEVCPPTGGSHGRTIDDATQRFKDAERRPRRKRDSSGDTSTTARPLQNLTPSPLNVVNVHCSVFKAQERGLSAIRAATARVGSPPLFAVLVYVADEHKAFETSARALFVIVGCSVEGIAGGRYSVFDQGHTPPWSGLRGVCSTCGAIGMSGCILPTSFTKVNSAGIINVSTKEGWRLYGRDHRRAGAQAEKGQGVDPGRACLQRGTRAQRCESGRDRQAAARTIHNQAPRRGLGSGLAVFAARRPTPKSPRPEYAGAA